MSYATFPQQFQKAYQSVKESNLSIIIVSIYPHFPLTSKSITKPRQNHKTGVSNYSDSNPTDE